MKSFYIVVLALVACAAAETYSTENDNLDIEGVVNNPEELEKFVGCFIDKNDCTDVTAAFKKDLPEAVATKCAKCTPAQKHLTDVFLTALKKSLPAAYEAFKGKFDPENKHFSDFETSVKQ